jgi:hypothetical protein
MSKTCAPPTWRRRCDISVRSMGNNTLNRLDQISGVLAVQRCGALHGSFRLMKP